MAQPQTDKYAFSRCLKHTQLAQLYHSSSSILLLISDVTIRLYRFRSILIRFFDLDSIRFRFFTICTPLLTELDSCVSAWERQCCGAGHSQSYPPTTAVVVGLNSEDVEWANTDQTVWHCDTELKLPSWTVRRHTLTLSIVWCSV